MERIVKRSDGEEMVGVSKERGSVSTIYLEYGMSGSRLSKRLGRRTE